MTNLTAIREDETLNMLGFTEAYTGKKFILMKENFNRAVKELQNWRDNQFADNFTAMLFRLICKADDENKKKILNGFPDEMFAYLLWYKSTSEEEFFAEWLQLGGNDEIHN